MGNFQMSLSDRSFQCAGLGFNSEAEIADTVTNFQSQWPPEFLSHEFKELNPQTTQDKF